ncbi:MAG: WD40 repeat domain-containing protein, partial [Planctomycetales bacterium]|nr:WD40 repeat domain-containing protein [Planctomycetales bacterium]
PSRDTHRGQVLPLNRPVQLVATVQYAAGRAAVQLDADGRRIFSWRGTSNRAGTSQYVQPNEPSALCLGNDTASIRLSNVRLVPLKGEGEPIVFADPADDPQRAAAERAIWKGGSVTLLADESTPRAQLEAPPVLDNIQSQRRFEGHTQPVKSVVVSHDGTLAASGSGWPTGDKTVRIWDVESGKTIRVLEIGERVMALAFTLDDSRLLVGGANALPLSVWDVQTGSMIQKLDTGNATYVEEVAISPDGSKLIAVVGGTGRLMAWNEQLEPLPYIRDTASSIAITPDSQFMAGGRADGSIDVFSLDTGEVVRSLEGPTFNGNSTLAYTVAASPDGQWLVAGYKEGKLRVWDWASGSVLHDVRTQANGHESLAFTPDSRYVIASGMPGMMSVVDVASGHVIATTPRTRGDGWSVAMMPDGRSVLSGGGVHWSDGWKPTGDFALRVWQLPDGLERLAAEAADREPPRYVVEARRFSEIPDQPQIVSIGLQGSQWLRDEDLAYFAGLDELRALSIEGTNVSPGGFQKLRQSLPGCQIAYDASNRDVVLDLTGRGVTDETLALAIEGQWPTHLVLEGEGITDASLPMVAEIPGLKRLDIWKANIT